MKMNPIYKKLLLVTIVFGPIYWLVFTEDGQRRTDMALIALINDATDMNIAFAKLRGSAREADLTGSFPKVDFICANEESRFGERTCASEIAAFNGAPAKYAAVFFHDGFMSAVKMTYRRPYHRFVQERIYLELGEPDLENDAKLWRWNTDFGTVLMSVETPPDDEEPSVIWLANR